MCGGIVILPGLRGLRSDLVRFLFWPVFEDPTRLTIAALAYVFSTCRTVCAKRLPKTVSFGTPWNPRLYPKSGVGDINRPARCKYRIICHRARRTEGGRKCIITVTCHLLTSSSQPNHTYPILTARPYSHIFVTSSHYVKEYCLFSRDWHRWCWTRLRTGTSGLG